MNNRIIDVSEPGCRLSIKDRQLVIERHGQMAGTMPMSDVACIVLTHQHTVVTQHVFALLGEHGGIVVICDATHKPISISLPLFGHSNQNLRLRQQIAITEPRRKRLWQQIVRCKIRSQAATLSRLGRKASALDKLDQRVASGDPTNVEAHAARAYWQSLLGAGFFRRRPQGGDMQNNALDYGYAILRATMARAICSSSLHPTLGLHHSHRDNSFALADDLMEPFRPLVDEAVSRFEPHDPSSRSMDRQTKQAILAPMLGRVEWTDGARTVFDACTRVTASLAQVLAGARKLLDLPLCVVPVE